MDDSARPPPPPPATMTTTTTTIMAATESTSKRKRSPSVSAVPNLAPPAKASKTSSSQLSINYLARQSPEDLPLLNKDDALPNLMVLLSAYSNVLDRHESLASNLGARPLGPILIKRFERCFDAPPRVVASHHRGSSVLNDDPSHQITWLEVIEFARSHPGQFTLEAFSEGRRVCQFYYPQKQLRVQISEEDFLFINSGRCQELIPPLPIWEDEEKEVGACDVLEAKLKDLTNIADMVAARTRQLSHRLKGRRTAILERRAEGGSGTPAKASAPQTTTAPLSNAGASGFVAANAANGVAKLNGDTESGSGSFAAVHSELLRHLESLPHNQGQGQGHMHSRTHSLLGMADNHHLGNLGKHIEGTMTDLVHTGTARSANSSLSPAPLTAFTTDGSYHYGAEPGTSGRPFGSGVATGTGRRPSSSTGGQNYGNTPNKHNFSRPLPPALESSQPFRPLCQAHMDGLTRGARVLPPCDRCRRLRMDCVKNLTSCQGCTKKHARCHWRDVSRDELSALVQNMDTPYDVALYKGEHGISDGEESDDDDSNPLEDLEALGEKEEQEREHEIRENAEGLRNAKELARQAWEDGLPSEQPQGAGQLEGSGTQQSGIAIATTPATAADVGPATSQPGPEHVATDQIPAAITTAPTHALTVLERVGPLPVPETAVSTTTSDWAVLPQPTSHADAAQTYGGFRPVNEPIRP